jgi:hypothetical protein
MCPSQHHRELSPEDVRALLSQPPPGIDVLPEGDGFSLRGEGTRGGSMELTGPQFGNLTDAATSGRLPLVVSAAIERTI